MGLLNPFPTFAVATMVELRARLRPCTTPARLTQLAQARNDPAQMMQGTVFAVLYQMRLAHVMLLFATQIDSQAERCGYRALQCGSLTTKDGSQAFHQALPSAPAPTLRPRRRRSSWASRRSSSPQPVAAAKPNRVGRPVACAASPCRVGRALIQAASPHARRSTPRPLAGSFNPHHRCRLPRRIRQPSGRGALSSIRGPPTPPAPALPHLDAAAVSAAASRTVRVHLEHVVGECAEPICPRRASGEGRSLSPATARGRRSSGR
jgi:hypothetical protein